MGQPICFFKKRSLFLTQSNLRQNLIVFILLKMSKASKISNGSHNCFLVFSKATLEFCYVFVETLLHNFCPHYLVSKKDNYVNILITLQMFLIVGLYFFLLKMEEKIIAYSKIVLNRYTNPKISFLVNSKVYDHPLPN